MDTGELTGVVSPITLAECLVHPLAGGQAAIAQTYRDLLTAGAGTEFVSIGSEAAARAAELRARYRIALLDALQVSLAVLSRCDAFLTNDRALTRLTVIPVILGDELVPT
jgi:predicted nucleic acid-binding protein